MGLQYTTQLVLEEHYESLIDESIEELIKCSDSVNEKCPSNLQNDKLYATLEGNSKTLNGLDQNPDITGPI